MRMLTLLRPIALTGLCLSAVGARTQAAGDWTLVYAHPAVGKYEDMSFPDEKHGWVASASGSILMTSDGGVTWSVQTNGLQRLRSIHFLNAKHGFAGSLAGILYETIDGGATWTDITARLPRVGKGFCGITHVGKRVYVVGRYNLGAADYFYSPDEGKTWQAQDLLSLADGLVNVSFLNDKIGFIGGMGKGATPSPNGTGPAIILKTTDGGKNWRVVFEHAGGRGYAWKLFPIDSKLIYAGLQSQDGVYRIAKTTDGGDHWDTLTVATGRPNGPAIQGIGFIDANTGFVGGFFVGMYQTTDGGKSWTFVQMPDGIINRFAKVGNSLFTAGTRGVLRYDAHHVTH